MEPFVQPGDPKQLLRIIEEAEKWYERSNGKQAIVVYWDIIIERYRLAYVGLFASYDRNKVIDVVKIPK